MTNFYEGQLVFDRKRTDPTDDILVVVDAHVGTLLDLDDDETRRKVKHNDTNTSLNDGSPVPDSEPVIKCAYVNNEDNFDPELGERVYTFPEFRLGDVKTSEETPIGDNAPFEWALIHFFAELVAELEQSDITIEDAEDLQVLAMQSEIAGNVIASGTNKATRFADY